MEYYKCLECGSTEFTQRADGTKMCKYCGSIVSQGTSEDFIAASSGAINKIDHALSSGKKNRYVAMLLAFFLGFIGGQYFYLRRFWIGGLCLLFCWTYIPCIWGIVHAIILLSMSEYDFNIKYNSSK